MTVKKLILIPIKPHLETKDVLYLMSKQKLINSNTVQLEFIKADINGPLKSSSIDDLSLDKLGKKPVWHKFLYTLFPNPAVSEDTTSVYMCLFNKEDVFDNTIDSLSGDMLLKKVRENDIIDQESLAAFSSILFQSEEVKKYLINSNLE